MSERENVDKNAPQARQRVKRSIARVPLRCKLSRDVWHRFKLIEVLIDHELLAYVVHGTENVDWRWAER